MVGPIETYLAAMAAAAAAVTTAVLAYSHRARSRRRKDAALAERYLTVLNRKMLEGGDSPCVFPQIGRRRSRTILASVISEMEAATYGYDRSVASGIVRRYALDRTILRRAAASVGARRAQWLYILSLLDTDERTYRKMMGRFSRSRNRYVTLCLLLASLNHTPERCIDILSECGRELSPLDISEVLMMLKRGLIQVAYQPMLKSEHSNVRLLGLCIARHFGIVEAEEYIAAAVDSVDRRVSSDAIFTLCSLRLKLDRPEVRRAAAGMDARSRRIWYRHLASEGYSSRSVERILPDPDRRAMHEWVEEVVGSYKRCLTPWNEDI